MHACYVPTGCKTQLGKLAMMKHLPPASQKARLKRPIQNRSRTGVPKRAGRLGWWMRADAGRNLEISDDERLPYPGHSDASIRSLPASGSVTHASQLAGIRSVPLSVSM